MPPLQRAGFAAELNVWVLRDWKPYPHQSWLNKDNIDLIPTILQVGGPMSGLQGISLGRRKRHVCCQLGRQQMETLWESRVIFFT